MQAARYGVRVAALLTLILCFACLALPHAAMATSVKTPNASESSDSSIKNLDNDSVRLFGDVISAGQSIHITKPEVPSNLIAAAKSIDVSGGKIGADVIVAGSSITIEDTLIGNNVFAAAETVTSKGTVAGSINAAAKTVYLGGQASAATAMAETVTVDGVFAGDVNVSAKNVIIGDNAVVKGKLIVEAKEKPSIPATADIADLKFTQNTSDAELGIAGAEFAAFLASMSIFFIIIGVLSTILLVVLMLALTTDRPYADAANALRTKTARVLLTGFLTMLLVPIAVIILFVLGVGWYIAFVILLICGVLSMIAEAFTSLALGCLVFKKMNRWGAGILMSLIIGVVSLIPFVGVLAAIFCDIYTVGYVCTTYFDWRKGRKVQNRDAQPIQGMPGAAPMPQPEPVTGPIPDALVMTPQAPVADPQVPVAEPQVQPVIPQEQAQPTEPIDTGADSQPPVNNA